MAYKGPLTGNHGITSGQSAVIVPLAGASAGDGAIVGVAYNWTVPTVTAPSGWVLLDGPDDYTGGNRVYLFGKVLTQADVSDGLAVFQLSAATRVVAAGLLFDDVDTTAPFGTPVITQQSGQVPDVTTTQPGSLVVYFGSNANGAGASNALAYSNATEVASPVTNFASGVNMAATAAYTDAPTAGVVDGGTVTGTLSTWQVYGVEVRQAAGANMDAEATPAENVEPGTTVTLDSSGSTGVAAGRTWTQESGPTAALSNPTATTPTIVAPPTLAGGALVFRVTDDTTGAWAETTVDVLPSSRRVKLGGVMAPTYRRALLP